MESFGELIRKIRLSRGLLLREVAAQLDVDASYLSRIEGNVKRARREHIPRIAAALAADENELLIAYLSDRITYALAGEKLAMKVMSVAEKKIRYIAGQRDHNMEQPTKNEE
jgi:transcriptional regulator with XRE-family HTH domain